jgi:exodeoxyribonuclease X
MLMHLDRPKLAIAHNAAFDRPFVKAIAPDWNPDWICTLKCSIMTWPDSPRHTNQVLRYYLGLKPALLTAFPELAPHRALYDIIVTREIFHTLCALNPLDRLLEWSNNPILLPKVTFGKHKGRAWSEVDRGYLRWCLTQEDMNEDVLFTARHWFDRR